jgi:hypothetical protein
MNELTTRDLTASIWWNPFTVERIRLRTPLSPDECIQRIQANINSYKYWRGENWRTDDPAERPFVGAARRDHFTLVKNSMSTQDFLPVKRSSFRPIAKGEILPDAANAGGSVISIRLFLHVWTRAMILLLMAGFAGAFLLSFLGAAGVIDVGRELSNPFEVLTVAVVSGIMFYPFYVLLFSFTRGERVFLVKTLQRILQASDLYSGLYTGMDPERLRQQRFPSGASGTAE